MDQFSLFEDVKYWIPEIDNYCRLWRCPDCGKAYVDGRIGWYQWKNHNFCSYCGARLFYPIINDDRIDDESEYI